MNFVRKHALAYQREHGGDLDTGGAARVRQCRRRLWRQRQPARRQRRLERRGRARRGLSCAARASPTASTASRQRQDGVLRSMLGEVDVAYQNLDSIELGVTTVDHYFDTLGGISRAVRRARGRRRPRLYRRPDPRRRQGAHARRAGRARDPHPRAQSEMVRGAAEARLRGRAPDRGQRDQHARLVGDHRPGGALGLPAAHRDLRARRRRCAERLAALNPTASAKLANRLHRGA